MKILYSVQATGNGHISRAIEILPHLQKYGEVDVFLSGSNSSLYMAGLGNGTLIRSKGISLFYNRGGGLNYWKTLANFKPIRTYREACELPVEKYDAVINDFEAITSLACSIKEVYSVGFGHQASFHFPNVPFSQKFDPIGRSILMNYAKATDYVGLHFKNYSDEICTPIVNHSIYNLSNSVFFPKKDFGSVVVYLPSYDPLFVAKSLEKHKDFFFTIYGSVKNCNYELNPPTKNSVIIQPHKGRFIKDLIRCQYVITNAGFETPAEALALSKRLLVIPIKGQYEQACNAEALKLFGVPIFCSLKDLSDNFISELLKEPQQRLVLSNSTDSIVEKVMKKFK